jgi:tight adherence protein B
VIEQNLIAAAIIAGLTVAVFFVARLLLDRGRARVERRLAYADGDTDLATPAEAPPEFATRVDRSFSDLVLRTGLGLTAGQTLGLFAFIGIGLALVMFFWRGEEWAAALGLALGLILTYAILLVLQGRRRRLIQRQLPDAFYFLARSLRAGLSLEQALTRAGEQLEEPLAGELRRASSQIQLGLHPYQALQITANRLGIADFDVFVSTVGLYYQSGGNLALLLDRLAASTRDRIQFLGYFRAATALGRTGGFLLAAAPPLLVIAYLIWQPDFANALFQTAAGLQLLGIAAVLEIVGLVWLIYLLRVDY